MASSKNRAIGWILGVALLCGAALGALVLAQRGAGASRVVAASGAGSTPAARAGDLAAGGAQGAARRASAGVPELAGGIEIRPGVRLSGPGRLSGRVVERGGAPVAGARVELHTLPPTG